MLGKAPLAIHGDIEDAAAAAQQLDISARDLPELLPHTEGVTLIASTDAVLDDDLHLTGLWG